VPSLERGKNSRAEKIGGRSMEKTEGGRVAVERRGTPERSGFLSQGRLCRHHRTTVSQKLDQNFLAPIESSLQ